MNPIQFLEVANAVLRQPIQYPEIPNFGVVASAEYANGDFVVVFSESSPPAATAAGLTE